MNQLDVCAHLSNLTNLYHDKFVYFRVPLFVIPHLGRRTAGKMRVGEIKSSLTRFPRLGGVGQVEISIKVRK